MVVLSETIANGKMMLTDEILNDEKVFKIWFISTYLSKFNKYPDLDGFEISNLVRSPSKTLQEYFEEVSYIVSVCLHGEDISRRIFEGSRKREIVLITKITSYILVNKLRYSKCAVAKILEKNHATIIHHIKTVEGFIIHDKQFSQRFKEISTILKKRGLILN